MSKSEVDDAEDLEGATEAFIAAVVSNLPATPTRLDQLRTAQSEDETLQTVFKYCEQGWPIKNSLSGNLKPYWSVKDELTIHNGLLLRGNRIVIPSSLQEDILQKLHEGHQGIVKTQLRARTSVWWPGVTKQIQCFIQKCKTCCKSFPTQTEPLIPTELPNHPWQKLGSDLFEYKGAVYILVVDYFSRYVEILKLSTTTSASIIVALKTIFSRHGIPETLVTDNGPQYSSEEFRCFSVSYDFKHLTSSPYYPRGNGESERAVRTVKNFLKDCNDPHIALLTYRATPLSWCGISPAELLMGRKLRTSVPESEENFTPQWPDLQKFRTDDKQYKKNQKRNYDRRHRTHDLPEFPDDTPVFIRNGGSSNVVPGRIVTSTGPRSYTVETPTGLSRRNRSQLNYRPVDKVPQSVVPQGIAERSPVMTRTRTGTVMRPPDKLNL